jgi:hypothetical protein
VGMVHFEDQIDHKLIEPRVCISCFISPESLKHMCTIEKVDVHSYDKR